MPKTTKEKPEEKNKKSLNSKSTTTKKSASKTVAKKETNKTVKKDSKKTTSKDTTPKKTVSKTTTSKKATTTKKATSTKKSPSKNNTKKTKKSKSINTLEYYDLPYRYNQTIVKMLAQTPKKLFVYWDISDDDRKKYIKEYGESFFENTIPILIIHNKTMNYSFEIEINDFANCWYFDINDEKCEYVVELGRKPNYYKNNNINIPNNYLYITSSNKIESPNGHILFEQNLNTLFFRNVKTNEEFSKNITNINFMKFFGKIYNMHDLYKIIYQDDSLLNIDNPSSNFKIY